MEREVNAGNEKETNDDGNIDAGNNDGAKVELIDPFGKRFNEVINFSLVVPSDRFVLSSTTWSGNRPAEEPADHNALFRGT